MPDLLPKIITVPETAKVYSPSPSKAAPVSELKKQALESQTQSAKATERHSTEQYQGAGTYSSTEVSYVESLMGLLPAQKMSEVMLRTGIPMPANLGQDVDTLV